eukprot:645790-Amphidinium_carterae.1
MLEQSYRFYYSLCYLICIEFSLVVKWTKKHLGCAALVLNKDCNAWGRSFSLGAVATSKLNARGLGKR